MLLELPVHRQLSLIFAIHVSRKIEGQKLMKLGYKMEEGAIEGGNSLGNFGVLG